MHAHVLSYTGRHAYLVGYDSAPTRSARLPIVSGYLKVLSQFRVPIVLLFHEAPYNASSPTTLISKYQARDYGTIIDSVSHHHKSINGSYGTQRMMVSPDLFVPLVDRGGLLGFEILPWERGDEELCDIYTITSAASWNPSLHPCLTLPAQQGGVLNLQMMLLNIS